MISFVDLSSKGGGGSSGWETTGSMDVQFENYDIPCGLVIEGWWREFWLGNHRSRLVTARRIVFEHTSL